MHADRDATGTYIPPLRHGWVAGAQTPEQHIQGSRDHGVEQVLALDPPHVCFELRRIFGEYVVPVPLVDMDKITPEEIDRLLSQGAAGIKFICPMHSYGDNRYFPLYDVIRSRKALAVFHTGYLSDILLRPGALLAREDYVDITHMRPAAIDRIARVFPDLKILMAHFGNPWWEEAWNVIHSFKNVHADLSGGTAYKRPMEMWKMIFTHGGKPDHATIGKLCYASDCSFCFQGLYEFAPFVEFYERFFDALDVPADLREQVNCGNAKRLIARTA
jgi:predicted TIM-barrel fold metal-dependent hydrolase